MLQRHGCEIYLAKLTEIVTSHKSSRPGFYSNIASEQRGLYECFSHSANSQVLTQQAIKQMESEYLMKR